MDSPEQMVCRALLLATDQNHELVRKAEEQLNAWELQSGFFPTLARLLNTQTAQQRDVNVRWMAAVYLKNGVNKYWRRNIRQELAAQEKEQVRCLLLANFRFEPVPQVALQVAVLIGRIARIDCPVDWPELMPELMNLLQAASEGENVNVAEQKNILLVLHHVVKALASRRLMAEKRVFEELTQNIFGYIFNLWTALTTLFFHQLETMATMAESTLERALLCLRVLRKLSIYGFSKSQQKSNGSLGFIEQLFSRLEQCLQCRFELKRLGAQDQLLMLLEKFIIKQIKTLNEFQDVHYSAFSAFVPAALEFSFNHVFHEGTRLIFDDNVINFQTFAIHCINLMKGIMLTITPVVSKNDPDASAPAFGLNDFFTNERLCYICEKIIMHYFLLTKIELDSWMDDPEGFVQDDGGDSWKYSLRPCIENLYVTCFSQYQPQMTAEVAKYIRKAQQIQLSADSDLKDILLKDAIYNAAGLASFHFFHEIDFDAWFSNQLLAELRIDSDNFRILRRRIIWLVAEWSGVKFSRDLRPLAYQACLHLLRTNEDMSIRLAASRTLATLIGDFEFAPEPFLPYLERSFNSLFVLLGDSRECDTKMNVLMNMSLLVEKMSDYIEPQADNLISYLPLLWKESEDYNMLRCAIIATLQQLVKAIRDIPENMKSFLYGVIELSTNLNEPSHIYLMEEGLALWWVVVENSTTMSPQLVALCKNLLPIIEMSSENLRTILVIIQAYILLDASSFLDRHGKQFVNFCTRLFEDTRPEGIVMMIKVLEVCLKSDANFGLELVRPALPYIFKQVYLNQDYPMVLGMYLMMVARVLLINQTVFMEVIQELQLPNALETILDVLITKMPVITEPEKRKLFCLAFGSIFSNNSMLLERFPGIMQNISETLVEIMLEEEECSEDTRDVALRKPTTYCDSLVFLDEHNVETIDYCTADDFDYKTYHYDRCRQLSLKDPVHKIKLPEYLEWQLNSLRIQLGEEQYQRVMQTVDPDILQKISQFVKLNLNIQIQPN